VIDVLGAKVHVVTCIFSLFSAVFWRLQSAFHRDLPEPGVEPRPPYAYQAVALTTSQLQGNLSGAAQSPGNPFLPPQAVHQSFPIIRFRHAGMIEPEDSFAGTNLLLNLIPVLDFGGMRIRRFRRSSILSHYALRSSLATIVLGIMTASERKSGSPKQGRCPYLVVRDLAAAGGEPG